MSSYKWSSYRNIQIIAVELTTNNHSLLNIDYQSFFLFIDHKYPILIIVSKYHKQHNYGLIDMRSHSLATSLWADFDGLIDC